jgi:hypothetical protein
VDEGRGRQRAYADLLTGLIDLGPTGATDRFDALLDQARSAGLIDTDTARVLRWWQRESLRAQADHILATAPSMLTALDAAQAQAHESADLAEEAWERARADAPAPSAAAAPATASTPTTSAAPSEAPQDDGVEGSIGGRHRARPHAETIDDTPLFAEVLADNHVVPGSNEPITPPATGSDLPFEVVSGVAESATASDAQIVDLDAPVRRRRLLVAGLTVIDADRSVLPLADPP